jgi:hypothetical protein
MKKHLASCEPGVLLTYSRTGLALLLAGVGFHVSVKICVPLRDTLQAESLAEVGVEYFPGLEQKRISHHFKPPDLFATTLALGHMQFGCPSPRGNGY